MVNLSLYSIKAVILLDAEGNRVLAKYYGTENNTLKQQKQFEKGLFDKTKRAQGKMNCFNIIYMDSILFLLFRRSYFIR